MPIVTGDNDTKSLMANQYDDMLNSAAAMCFWAWVTLLGWNQTKIWNKFVLTFLKFCMILA